MERILNRVVALLAGSLWLLAANLANAETPALTQESSINPTEVLSSEDEGRLLDAQIQLIEVEIKLLKAELARKNGQRAQVQNYVNALKLDQQRLSFSEGFSHRLLALEAYLNSVEPDTLQTVQFAFNPDKVIALLPLSGAYQQVGKALLDGLTHALTQSFPDVEVQVVDTAIYDSMFDVWEWVRLNQPSFIFGPLNKANVEAFAKLGALTPNLVLNFLEEETASTASLTLHADHYSIASLIAYIEKNQYERIVVLKDDSAQSNRLADTFSASMQQHYQDYPVQPVVRDLMLDGNVDQTFEILLNTRDSLARKNWLQKTIGHRLVYEERSRQDTELIVSFLPYRQAMQVTPLLSYYHLSQVTHLWVPSRLPNLHRFIKSLDFWQGTLTILPHYYVQSIFNKQARDATVSEVGIFYALGELAAKIAIHPADYEQVRTDTMLGALSRKKTLHWTFESDVYWLDAGVFESVTQ